MRRIIFMMLLCTAVINAVQSQTPSTATQPGAGTQPVATKPAAYNNSIPLNAVFTWQAMKPIQAESDITSNSRVISEVQKVTQYFDGLGRPLQTVSKGTSPLGFDVVAPVVYDGFGRETIKYLPYTANTANGNFKSDPFAEQETFLKSVYNPGNDPAGEQYFYGKTDYEASPLNRVSKTYAPGNNWVGDGIGTGVQYFANTQTEGVRVWNIDIANGSLPVTNRVYGDGLLYKTITTDEQGKKLIEYKDKEGRVILKKVQIGNTPGNAHNGWLCTYYVYDNFGSLRFVIPPKATDWLNDNGWTFESSAWSTSTMAKELCFSYEYDDECRMIVKRVPGAGEVYMVYDARDRLVMTQDENMRTPPFRGAGGLAGNRI